MKIGGKHLLFEYKPLGFVQSPLGELAVFSISFGDMHQVTSHRGLSVKGVGPTDLAHRLLRFILHKKGQLKGDSTKPDAPTLTEEEVRALPGDVVEAAIGQFIESQQHLYKRWTPEVKTNEKGESVTSLSLGEVKYPKHDNETNVQYLHRLLVMEEEDTKRQMAVLLRSAHFSAGVSESIKNTLGMGESISKMLDTLRPPKFLDIGKPFQGINIPSLNEGFRAHPTLTPSTVSPPSIDYAAITEGIEKARWAPFHAVNSRLDELIDLTAKSSEFMVQVNETQTRVAAEIKASGEDASKIGVNSLAINRRVFWLSVIVVVLTVLGLAITAASWWSSGDTTQQADKRAEQVVKGLADVKGAIADSGQSSARDIAAMLNELKTARAEQASKTESILNAQVRALERQVKQSAADRNTIESLNDRILQLERQLRRLGATTMPQPQSGPTTSPAG